MKTDLLQSLIERYDNEPANCGRRMREWLEADHDEFLRAAVAALRLAGEKRGYRYLLALLAGNGLLSGCLCDPSLTLPTAVMLARIGIRIDPGLDAALARRLTESLHADVPGPEADTARTLDLLSEISKGTRLVPVLIQLLQHPNPRIRSKAALLIGRRNQNSRWVEQRKVEKDPRVRANAIEGLWGVADEGARSVLWEAAGDSNNRVAGNAVLGLYRIGDLRSIELALQMAERAEPLFRATAAWIMGESADPRYLAALGRLLSDSDGRVRTRAFRSVSRIRRRMSSPGASLQVHLTEARRLGDDVRQLRIAVADVHGVAPWLADTDFVISEDAQPVVRYDVHCRPAAAVLVVGFAIPRRPGLEPSAVEAALLACLPRKRAADAWGVTRYSGNGSGVEPVMGETEPQRFAAKASLLRDRIGNPASRSAVAGSLLDAVTALLTGAASLAAERHLVVVTSARDAASLAAEAGRICSRARHSGVAIHILADSDDPAPILLALSEETGGRLFRARGPEQMSAALSRLFWGWQSQHEIRYRIAESKPAAAGPEVRVQVWSEIGSGEDALALS